MQGRRVAITGVTAGIGRATALALSARGAQLTLLNRNPQKAQELAREIEATGAPAPRLIEMDMASLASVRAAGAELVRHTPQLDVLINNAGIVNTSRRITVDGFEETMAVYHFAPFLLTGLLLPSILQGDRPRIVNVSSDAHAFVRGMGFDDLHAEQRFRTFTQYGRSKLANILFTRELAARLGDQGPNVNALHPGAVSTSLGTQNGALGRGLHKLLRPFFRTPEDGAATTLHVATDPAVDGVSGRYFANCEEVAPKPWGMDDDAGRQLWAISEEAVSFRYG